MSAVTLRRDPSRYADHRVTTGVDRLDLVEGALHNVLQLRVVLGRRSRQRVPAYDQAMSDDHQTLLIRGIAARALSAAMRAGDKTEDLDEVRALDELRRIDADADTLRQAAEAVRRFTLPPDEPADKAERLEFFQKMVGASTATQDMEAQLRAREWLQLLAVERTIR